MRKKGKNLQKYTNIDSQCANKAANFTSTGFYLPQLKYDVIKRQILILRCHFGDACDTKMFLKTFFVVKRKNLPLYILSAKWRGKKVKEAFWD